MKIIKQPHGGAIRQSEKGETANPNGRPRKGISAVNHELKEAGFAPATKSDIEANYMSMLQLGEEKLKELGNDKDKPMLVRIIARNMLSGKGFDIIEKMLDRGIGKPKQEGSIEHSGSIQNVGILDKFLNSRKGNSTQEKS